MMMYLSLSFLAALLLLPSTTQGFIVRPVTTGSHMVGSRTSSSFRTTTTTTSLHLFVEPSTFVDAANTLLTTVADSASFADGPPETAGISYSRASYYTILGLYLLSFPGLWSQIKRSTSAKIKRKTFVTAGEAVEGGKSLRQQAGEIMACKWKPKIIKCCLEERGGKHGAWNRISHPRTLFYTFQMCRTMVLYMSCMYDLFALFLDMTSNNYEVVEAGETITFRGIVQRNVGQAFFLVFCTVLGLLSLALVLQIQFQDLELPLIGKPNWFYLALLSPYAGIYYWSAGDRVDDISVKLSTNPEETENEILVQGSDEELERMWRTLEWREKGMVKVPGLLEPVN